MKRWVWVSIMGATLMVACSRKPTQPPFAPVSWQASFEAFERGGQGIQSPQGAVVAVEGNVFRDETPVHVDVSDRLPWFLSDFETFQASDVITVRYRSTDLAHPELGTGVTALEGLAYGLLVAIPLRASISEEWGNAVVVINGTVTAMPYGVTRRAGEHASLRIPIAFLQMFGQPGENTLHVFFAEGRSSTLSPAELEALLPPDLRGRVSLQFSLDELKQGTPFRLEVRGDHVAPGENGIPFSSGVLAGKRYGFFDPVAVFFSPGLNVMSLWSPAPCAPVPIPTVVPGCYASSEEPVLTALYQAIKNKIGDTHAKKLVGYYKFQHSGHKGFEGPGNRLWDLFNSRFVELGSDTQTHAIALTGFSMGGLISRQAATRNPKKVLGVATLNTPHLGSIIADLVTYKDRDGDFMDYVVRQVRNSYGSAVAGRFEDDVNGQPLFWGMFDGLYDPRTYIAITAIPEVYDCLSGQGSLGLICDYVKNRIPYVGPVLGQLSLAPRSAIAPLRYDPPDNKPFARVCVASVGRTLDIPDPMPSGKEIQRLFSAELGRSSINPPLHAFMSHRLPDLELGVNTVLWILGRYMGALHQPNAGGCSQFYQDPSTPHLNDGVVAEWSGLFEGGGDVYPNISRYLDRHPHYHLDIPELKSEIGGSAWAERVASWVETYLKNEWMKDYRFLYELGWEYLFSTASIDLEFYALFRDNNLTLDYLRADPVRRWQEFHTYGAVTQERHGLVGTGISRNAGPEGIALKRNSSTTPKVYLVAAVKNPPLVSLDLKVKFHIFEKPNTTSLSGVKDTLIETTKRFTRYASDLYWIIGELDQSGKFVKKIDSWVGVKELDDTTRNGNVTCYWKVRVLDYQDANGMPIKDNYPILQPGLGTPVQQVRCDTAAIQVAAQEVVLH